MNQNGRRSTDGIFKCIFLNEHVWISIKNSVKFFFKDPIDNKPTLDTFWLVDRVRLFVHYTIPLSSLCKLIWGHRNYEMPVRYILSSVWVRLSIFFQLSIIQYMGLCVFSVYPFPLWWLREYTLCLIIIIKSELWTIIHCLGFGHETMVCASCLFIFLWIRDMARLLRVTFVSWWYLPRIWPSVADMQHYYHAMYPTDDWPLAYMFSLVYFSVDVCLVGVLPHSVRKRRDPCIRICVPLTLASPLTRKQKSN